MIRESLYFSFAGRKSTEFGIYNVSMSDGLFEEQITANKSINEISVRGNPKPYFVDVKREPKQFQLTFAFLETWNDDLIDEVIRWLDVDFYEPLSFEANMDRVFYCMPVDGISLIHNGLKQGYLTLNMRCNSPFSYSPDLATPWLDCKNTNGGTFITPYQWIEDGIEHGTRIILDNRGHYNAPPSIWIRKIGNGDVSITNLSNSNQEFKFTGLLDQETIFIDCENEIITSSLPDVYRYDDFNDNYLNLVYGKNRLEVSGDAEIKLQYRYIFS